MPDSFDNAELIAWCEYAVGEMGLTNKMPNDKINIVRVGRKIRFDLPIHLTCMDGTVKFIKEVQGKGVQYPYLLEVCRLRNPYDIQKSTICTFIVGVDEYGFAHQDAKEPYIENDPLKPPEHEEVYY